MTSARPASRTVCRIRDVLLGDRLRRVEDQHRDLGAVDGGGGAQRGVVLVARRLLDPLADAGGVDEAPGAAAELDQLVDRVDGGAGDVVDDDPLRAGQPVEQRGLADVRLADDRDPARAADLGVPLRRRLRQRVEDRRRAGRPSRGRAARRPGSGSPSPRFQRPYASASARWSSTLLAASTTGLPDLRRILTTASSSSVMPTVASTTNSTASASVTAISAWARIVLGQPAGVGVPAAGVDDGEGAAVPVGVVGHPVAGHARDVLDDGLAAADDPVDQRRLADVGAADDGEHGDRAGGARRRRLGHIASWSVTPVSGSGSLRPWPGSGPGRVRPVSALA